MNNGCLFSFLSKNFIHFLDLLKCPIYNAPILMGLFFFEPLVSFLDGSRLNSLTSSTTTHLDTKNWVSVENDKTLPPPPSS